MAAGNTFFNPTVQAVIPVLTTEEQRLAANSIGWSTGRLVQILASAVVGGLIALVGTGPAFALNAATFVFSAAMIVSLRIPGHAGQLGAASKRGLISYFGDARTGSRTRFGTGSCRGCCWCKGSLRWRLARPAPCSSCCLSGI
jgi:hypothetical protein